MKKRKSWLVLLVVLLLAAGSYAVYYFVLSPAPSVEEAPALQTTQVYRGDLLISVDGSGNLLPAAEIELGFQISGLLTELEVTVGDTVQADDVLARLDTRELELELARSRSQLDQAQANLDKLMVDPKDTSVTSAQSSVYQAVINRDETLVTKEASSEQARLTWTQKANALRDAQASYEDIYWANRELETKLAPHGGTLPDAKVDQEEQAWRAVENAEAAMEQARLSYEQALQQEESANLKAQSQVVSAQANLDGLFVGAGAAEIASAQASVEQSRISYELAQIKLDKAVLRAPFAGTVLAVNAQAGEQVGTNALLTLADLQAPLLRFWVEESDMSGVAVGHRLNIFFEALPDLVYSGEIVQVEPALVTVEGTPAVQAWATVDLDAHSVQLFSGMAADVEIIAAEANDVLLVPLQALRELDSGQYAVFVVGPDAELEMRLVEVGLRDFVNAEIVSGLQVGETISLGEATSSTSTVPAPSGGVIPGIGPIGR